MPAEIVPCKLFISLSLEKQKILNNVKKNTVYLLMSLECSRKGASLLPTGGFGLCGSIFTRIGWFVLGYYRLLLLEVSCKGGKQRILAFCLKRNQWNKLILRRLQWHSDPSFRAAFIHEIREQARRRSPGGYHRHSQHTAKKILGNHFIWLGYILSWLSSANNFIGLNADPKMCT